MSITLLTRSQNSAGERVRIALNLKGLEYEYTVAPTLSSAAYRKLNPQGLMPSILFDGEPVTQSLAIIELLEEQYPDPAIFPSDPVLRARARAFAQTICSEIHSITVHRVREYLHKSMDLDKDMVMDWYRHWTSLSFEALEETLKARQQHFQFCFADYPTIADIALVPQVSNARRFNCSLEAYPTLLAVNQRCRELKAFRDATPENQPDFLG